MELNQHQNSDKAPVIIYADPECLIGKIDGCKNNPKNSFTIKESEHIPLSFFMSTILPFKSIENKDDIYRGKFCESLRAHTMKTINFKKKKWSH